MKKRMLLFLFIFISTFSGCKDIQNSTNEKSKNTDPETQIIEDAIYIKSSNNVYTKGCITDTTPHSYLDFDSMEKTILCAKPNCTHSNSECISKIVGDTPIIYGEYIYFLTSVSGVEEKPESREFYIKSALKRCSLYSSEIETIVEFTDCVPREYDGCVVADGILYFCADNMNPTKDDYGNIVYGNSGGKHYFCSIDLSTGVYTNHGSIFDDSQYSEADSSSTAKVTGYFDSQIYIEYSFLKKPMPQELTDDFDARDYFSIHNFTYDKKTNNLSKSDLPSASFMDNNTYLYSNYPDNSSTVIDGKKTYTVDGLNVNIYGKFYNGKIFMYDCWYDAQNCSKHSLQQYSGWNVLSFYDDCYIISNSNCSKYAKLTEEDLLALDKE